MAKLFPFECTVCDYEVQMSGKPDRLMLGPTIPVECLNCNTLYDQIQPDDIFTDRQETGVCPKCSSADFRPWDYRRKPCPKCKQGRMKVNPQGGILMAD